MWRRENVVWEAEAWWPSPVQDLPPTWASCRVASPHISKGSWVLTSQRESGLINVNGLWKPKGSLIKAVEPIAPGLTGLSCSLHSTRWTSTFFCGQWLPALVAMPLATYIYITYVCVYMYGQWHIYMWPRTMTVKTLARMP